MFRRAFSTASRITTIGIGGARREGRANVGIGLGVGLISAAAVAINSNESVVKAISDAELKKKPRWYQETVKRLENVIRKLSVYSYIEDPVLIDDALDILQRVDDLNHAEISWRFGRALVEKGNLLSKKEIHEKVEYYETALKSLSKALQTDPNLANAHKWYAIALIKLKQLAPRNPHSKKDAGKILDHLERAQKLAPDDALIPNLIGIEHFEKGNYDEAIKYLRVSEQLKPNFFIGNKTYEGLALSAKGDKLGATAILKQALQMPIRNRSDRKHRGMARSFLVLKLHVTKEELEVPDY